MENQKEYEKRYQAIRLYKKGHRFNKILQLVQRSRGWLYKWLSRPARIGTGGEELETHQTRRSAFSGIGAEVIHWELDQRKIRNIPSIATIARILFRYGKTGNKQGQKKNGKKQPSPYFKADHILLLSRL